MKKPLCTTAARAAFLSLPPELQCELQQQGFRPGRIEPSGALTMLVSNALSITEKQRAISAFRAATGQFGLDLQRISMIAPDSAWDDGCLLVCAADKQGLRPRLFDADGKPSDEVLEESTRHRAKH